jgi:uroporphyrinogen decarboxylase
MQTVQEEEMSQTRMTSVERFTRTFQHREADRVPITDVPWKATIERWRREGMGDTDFEEYFDIDRVQQPWLDSSPRYEKRTIEETGEHRIYTSEWGVTMKEWKHADSTPEFLDFTIVDPASWEAAKKRIAPTPDRIDWDWWKANYPVWQARGDWIQAVPWFGFDVAHSWTIGTERVLINLVENPAWLMDVFETMLETSLALWDIVWDAGYRFHSLYWYDDMGYKGHQFFSVRKYRQVLKPFHQRAIDWAHAKGIYAHLHSCGDVRPFVPELVAMGLDALNPLEVKAGMDPLALKREYGKDLVLHGGINAVLWDDPELVCAEMDRFVPVLKQDGGYIFSSDHSVPSSVSLDAFRRITGYAKQIGSY